jgi:hypothetical protein
MLIPNYQIAYCNIPENYNPNTHHCDKLIHDMQSIISDAVINKCETSSLTTRQEDKLKWSTNKALKRT